MIQSQTNKYRLSIRAYSNTNINISIWTFNTFLSSKLKRHCLNLFCSNNFINPHKSTIFSGSMT